MRQCYLNLFQKKKKHKNNVQQKRFSKKKNNYKYNIMLYKGNICRKIKVPNQVPKNRH